jgi:hypothetical protein
MSPRWWLGCTAGESDALSALCAIWVGFGGDVKGLADVPGGGINGGGVEEEAGASATVIPYRQGGVEAAGTYAWAAIKGGKTTSGVQAMAMRGGRAKEKPAAMETAGLMAAEIYLAAANSLTGMPRALATPSP